MPTSPIITFSGQKLEPAMNPEHARQTVVSLPPGTHARGTVLGQVTSGTAANEVQTVTITGTPTGGSIRLIFDGQITAAIDFDATAAEVETALEALSNIGAGNVACAGGAFPGTAVTVTFQAALGNINQPLMTAINSLTGGTTPAVAVTETTPGNSGGGGQWAPYADGNSDGTEVARMLLTYDTVVEVDGSHKIGGEHGESQRYAPAYYAGTFNTAELTGLDAAAVADLGRLISGTVTTGVLRMG